MKSNHTETILHEDQKKNSDQELLAAKSSKKSQKLLTYNYIAYSILNGTLYFTIAVKGGADLDKLMQINSFDFIVTLSACNSLVYAMFTYKTLEFLSLKPDSFTKFTFSIFAPFAASAFLTAGTAGAEVLGLNHNGALVIGIFLFTLRIVNCVDASVKFPQRFIDTYKAWSEAQTTRDYNEIARLLTVWIFSIGYAASTTDAVYNSMLTITGWLSISSQKAVPFFYVASALGALGALPLTVYWSHRGLRQLTYGGKINENGQTPDPTDRYTYLGLMCVLPSILGILGGATASTGNVFAQLGNFAIYARLLTSIFYALCAGTPGMATLLRNIVPQTNCRFFSFFQASTKSEETNNLLSQNEEAFLPSHLTR
jgi:hypothetical protein